jgi:ribose 5-phosphate isomerase A
MDPELSLKQQAADQVLEYIESGMIVGLGAGSTAVLAVRGLGAKLASGELTNILGIPCSREIEAEARSLESLTTLEEHQVIDLTFDGADEVDSALNLIKGGGGALLKLAAAGQPSRDHCRGQVKLSRAEHTLGSADRGDSLRLADARRVPGGTGAQPELRLC